MNIYVGNLSWTMTDEDLNSLFSQYGTVTSAKVLKDKVSGRSKGFGFVEMDDADAANAALPAPPRATGRPALAGSPRPGRRP